MTVKFTRFHRPMPPVVPGSVEGFIDSSAPRAGRSNANSFEFPAQAKTYANRIEVAFWNGDPKFHAGFAFDEIALILAELEARITVLEP